MGENDETLHVHICKNQTFEGSSFQSNIRYLAILNTKPLKFVYKMATVLFTLNCKVCNYCKLNSTSYPEYIHVPSWSILYCCQRASSNILNILIKYRQYKY